MKIYVTGSTGLVGNNLVDVLPSFGHDVIVSSSKSVNLLDYPSLLGFLVDKRPDFIIHAAGKVGGIQANRSDPYGFMTENLQMGLNVVRAAQEAGVRMMFNLSSSCSYPCALGRPLTEEDVLAGKLEPTNEGYAIAKASVLRLCAFASQKFGYQYKTLVPCNLYGRYDKFGEHNAHMLPAVIRRLHEAKRDGIRSVAIWGSGLARREFLLASDFAEMVAQLISRFDDVPQTLNVGVGSDRTIDEYYAAAASVVGYTGGFIHDLSKPEGMVRKLLDVSKQTALGIAPRHTLEEGIRETYDYYLSTQEAAA